jgi:hypothetical protein
VGEDQFEIIVTRINGKLSCVGGTCTYDDKTLLKGKAAKKTAILGFRKGKEEVLEIRKKEGK